jgi:parallel beta-helix repeat protein
MKLLDACKILGISPQEDLHPHLADFKQTREHIAKMIQDAPNKKLAEGYRQGLAEFDHAVAAVQAHLATAGGGAPTRPPRGRGLAYFAGFLVILTGAGVGGWRYLKSQQEQRDQHITELDQQGAKFIASRHWPEATAAFAGIEAMFPSSEIASKGRHAVEAGMAQDQAEFINHLTTLATSELAAGRLDQAQAAVRQVLDKYPQDKSATAIFDKIAAATAAQEATTANQQKALELLKMAIASDTGQPNPQALEWLRQADTLAPGTPEIAAGLAKFSSYVKTFRVPEDFATPEEALAAAHDRDRIILGAGNWSGPLTVDAAVEIQGTGSATTKVECTAAEGSVITLGPGAKGAKIAGISFRHTTVVGGSDRFSVALIRGGSVAFTDCRFSEASGHGLAVIEGGEAKVSRSHFSANGWDGAAATGQGSKLEIRDSESLNNLEHGIESWAGADLTLVNNRCEGNSRNGIHADNSPTSAIIEGNQLISNKEFGLVLDSAATGKISGNTVRSNLLGGIIIHTAAAAVPVTANEVTLNQGPGLILEKGLDPAAYSQNTLSQNQGEQTLINADLSLSEASPIPTAPGVPKIQKRKQQKR